MGPALLLLVFACAEGPEHRRAAVLDASDPAATRTALAALTDEVEFEAAFQALADADPARAQAVCGLPGDPRIDAWCARKKKRAHLWAAPHPVRAARSAAGPGSASLVPPLDLDGVEPEECLAMPEGRARQECAFEAAERLSQGGDVGAWPRIVEGCLAAGDFAPRCLGHSLGRIAREAGNAPASGDAAGWTALAETVRALGLPFEQAPTFAATVRSRAWSAALMVAFERMPQPSGEALDHLPAEATPFVRAALAHRVLATKPPSSLAEAVAAVEAALAARPAPSGPWPTLKPGGRSKERPTWTEDRPGDEGIPAQHYRETSRRAVAEDPRTDLVICVLEAAARQGPAARPLLEEAAGSADPLVLWTAERLLGGEAARPAPGR